MSLLVRTRTMGDDTGQEPLVDQFILLLTLKSDDNKGQFTLW